MGQAGGNTDELYANNGRLKMAESLLEQHPDIVKISKKYNRWQHVVDYKKFKKENALILKSQRPEGVNNYSMQLVQLSSPQVAA